MLLIILFKSFFQNNTAVNSFTTNDSTIYSVVDSFAYFPGGMIERNKFVNKTRAAAVAVDHGAEGVSSTEVEYCILVSDLDCNTTKIYLKFV